MHYSRSLRRLESDNARRNLLLLIVVTAIMAAWCGWFVTARIAIYANTSHARIEVEQEHHSVEAPLAGRITTLPPAAGAAIKAGDVLLELEATPAELERAEFQAKLAPAEDQRRSLTAELTAEEAALAEEDAGADGARHEAAAKVRAATSAVELAVEEERRLQALHDHALVSDLEILRARKFAEERRSQMQAAEYAAARVVNDLSARHSTRVARVARLRNDLALVASTRAQATAAAERLRFEIDRRTVRAPISGTLAEVSSLKIGNVVESGVKICTIVPEGTLRAVAFFTPGAALGRIRNGQRARLRLEGFPWTTFGSVGATVANVAGEVRDGTVRVELNLTRQADTAVPLEHGLPAEVDVEIERASPVALMLRSAGDRLRVNAASRR